MTNYYAFKGQNASCGKPNQTTGLYNTYGDLIAFSSKEKRDYFVENYYGNNPSEFVVSANKKQARGYCLGMSVRNYEEYLHYVDSNVDELYTDLVEFAA